MSKPTLFLHIGHPKTASTTLQEFLFQNWPALDNANYSLPTSELGIATGTATAPGNPLWTLERVRETKDAAPLLSWINSAGSQTNKLILSSECLIQEDYPVLFKEVSKLVNIQLIYYVRRQDKLLLSAWRQWGLKRGLSLDEFLERRLKNKQPDFSKIIENWADKCDIKQCHVRFLDPRFLMNGNVIEDFSKTLGFETPSVREIEDKNVSIDARLALFLSRYPELFDNVHDEEIFTLLRHAPEEGPTEKLRWSLEQFERLQEVFEPLNQQILSSYQPSHVGTPVIAPETAPLGPLPTIDEQKAYVTERLGSIPNANHPKLWKLNELMAMDDNLA